LQKTPETGAQRTFASPEAAEAALVKASKAGDQTALIAIFGPDSLAVFSTGDSNADQNRLSKFVTAYDQMHRWGKIKAGGQVLYVGADNYPFPIPLDKNSSGQWYFDTAAGKDEILARRIGGNELTAMEACQGIADAERQYFRMKHDRDKGARYAPNFVSNPGKEDGLYWPVAAGTMPSPLGQFGDFAAAASTSNSRHSAEFNGYRYRILTWSPAQSGGESDGANQRPATNFAILAYPIEYRNSGIMSFLISNDGTVYQRDLGVNTAEIANAITDYNPADGWTPAIKPATAAARTRP
jgi:hypothetical protein